MVRNIEDWLFRGAVCEPDKDKCKDCNKECIYQERELINGRKNNKK